MKINGKGDALRRPYRIYNPHHNNVLPFNSK